jgi:hypothetical protein
LILHSWLAAQGGQVGITCGQKMVGTAAAAAIRAKIIFGCGQWIASEFISQVPSCGPDLETVTAPHLPFCPKIETFVARTQEMIGCGLFSSHSRTNSILLLIV